MKHMRKLVTLVVVLAMVMAFMVPTAFAANDGSITIANTTPDTIYNVYKVFDATYSGDNVAYTYDGSNATFLDNLQDASSPFTVSGSSAPYNIEKKGDATDTEVLTFIKNNAANFGTAVATVTGDGDKVTISNLAYGYYYITTAVGSVVAIDNALKDVTVIDKIEDVGMPDKTESVDGGNTWVDTATASVGDTVMFKITGKLQRYSKGKLIENLEITDYMTDGLTFNNDIVVKVEGETLAEGTDYTFVHTPGNNGDPNNAELTITIPISIKENDNVTYNYKVGAAIEITYSATIDEDTIENAKEENKVCFADVNGFFGSDTVEVKNYNITLTKEDAKDENQKLAGASFKLYDAATGGSEIPVVLVSGTGTTESTTDNVYRPAKTGETGVEMVTGTTGKIVIKGLENDDYFFEETEAPAGYNKLTARTEKVTINGADATITVKNNTGTELPSTGGMGTTIFYILGGLMVVGAAVVLVTNKRMRGQM